MARRSFFDRLADHVERIVSHPVFFTACVLLILLWAPLILLFTVDTWQLIINTATTIITFLLLALLTNTQQRFEDRTDGKLDSLTKSVRSIEAHGRGSAMRADTDREVAAELLRRLAELGEHADPPCRHCGDPKTWHTGETWASHRDQWLQRWGVSDADPTEASDGPSAA